MTAIVLQIDAYKKPVLSTVQVSSEWTDLSFVKRRIEGRKRGCGLNYWAVTPSGDYVADCNTGRALALEYLGFVSKSAFPLQFIVLDMPRGEGRSGIEIGFLSAVSRAAMLGAYVFRDRLEEVVDG